MSDNSYRRLITTMYFLFSIVINTRRSSQWFHEKQITLESHYIFQILFMLSEQMDSRPTMSNSSSSSSTVDLATTSRSYLTLMENHLQIKLAKDKYLSWKTAILPYINGNKILHHVHGSTGRPPKTIVSLLCLYHNL